MGFGLAGLHMKGGLTGTSFTICELATPGKGSPSRASKTSKHQNRETRQGSYSRWD